MKADFTVSFDIESLNISNERCECLNQVYHSTSAAEMILKIASLCGGINIDELKWLADCVAYHAAFWPHTLLRYQAFLDLIKTDKDVKALARSTEFVSYCLKRAYPTNPFSKNHFTEKDIFEKEVIGKQLQTYYYIKIIELAFRMNLKYKIASDKKFAIEQSKIK